MLGKIGRKEWSKKRQKLLELKKKKNIILYIKRMRRCRTLGCNVGAHPVWIAGELAEGSACRNAGVRAHQCRGEAGEEGGGHPANWVCSLINSKAGKLRAAPSPCISTTWVLSKHLSRQTLLCEQEESIQPGPVEPKELLSCLSSMWWACTCFLT